MKKRKKQSSKVRDLKVSKDVTGGRRRHHGSGASASAGPGGPVGDRGGNAGPFGINSPQ
jgi:hypothetical protein